MGAGVSGKIWAVVMMGLIALCSVDALLAAYQHRPLTMLSALGLATWSLGYGLARIAQAWKVRLW
jgi:hypothetical protein